MRKGPDNAIAFYYTSLPGRIKLSVSFILGYKYLGGSTYIYAYLNNTEERVYFFVLSACHVYHASFVRGKPHCFQVSE